MRQVKQFTFNRVKYRVEYTGRIFGMTDRLDQVVGVPAMTIMAGDNFEAFHSALHECLEASGLPDGALHNFKGEPTTRDAARFLWTTWIKGGNQ